MAFNPDAHALGEFLDGTWELMPSRPWGLSRLGTVRNIARRGHASTGSLLYTRDPGRDIPMINRSGVERDHVVILAESTDRDYVTGFPILLVQDIDRALESIGKAARDNFAGKVVAITGSVGKTTTKNLLARALSGQHSIHAKLDNLNGLRSIRSRLLRLQDEEIAVFEVARIALPEAAELLRPDVVLITAIAEAHMEDLSSLQTVADVKGSLFRGLESSGTAVINMDTPHSSKLLEIANSYTNKIIKYGESDELDLSLVCYDYTEKLVVARVADQELSYHLGIAGKHNAYNSLGVMGVLRALDKDPRDYLREISSFQSVRGRGVAHEISMQGRSVTLVDDAYNANPTSMGASLESFGRSYAGRRKILILGDMLELGPGAAEFHANALRGVLDADPAKIYLVGPLMTELWRRLPNDLRGAHVMEARSLLALVPRDLQDNDAVLVKASRGTGLGALVKRWTETGSRNRESWRLVISGDVQGVGLRQWIKERSLEDGVSGWVRNRSDGRVEALVQGVGIDLSALLGQLYTGDHGAKVHSVSRRVTDVASVSDFRVRKTRNVA